MEVIKFRLNNIGRFEEIDVPLATSDSHTSNVTVFVGNNGSGKTSLLRGLATSLSWLVSQIRSERGRGSPIPELVINNEKPSASIDIEVLDDKGQSHNPEAHIEDYIVNWSVAKSRKGRKGEHKSDLWGAASLADHYRTLLSRDESTSLPLIAFYSVERVVLDIPLKIKDRHTFLQLDGYDNSLSQGVDFRRFFEWFREREDTENESGISDELFEQLRNAIGGDNGTWAKLNELQASSRDRQLTAVRSAIYTFMPDFSNLRVRRKPRLHMSIDKNDNTLNVSQLSQGEKSLMALIGDIARRLAMMNPQLENPLEGDGIVLVDEVDMHLHPKWQRSLIAQLSSTFPNCQFVLTTHSPLVISDSQGVLTYLIDGDGLTELSGLYGEDANSVLLGVMDTDVRNAKVNIKLNDLLDAIHTQDLNTAQRLLAQLEEELPARNMELAKARMLLRKQELRSAKDNEG